MCDVVTATNSITDYYDPGGFVMPGATEVTMYLDREEDVVINETFLTQLNGKIYCKHPDTDWQLMEVEPGQMLHCPAETELKLVLPQPYVEGSI